LVQSSIITDLGFPPARTRGPVPKRNYGFEKRQKELAKQEKRKLKAAKRADRSATSADEQEPDTALPPDADPQG
jgi:hypothetical protein